MSDHHIEIEPDNKYLFSIEIRSDSKMIVHLGVACYDKLKNVILPVQVYLYLYFRLAENKTVR
jgi:hypothetical protein